METDGWAFWNSNYATFNSNWISSTTQDKSPDARIENLTSIMPTAKKVTISAASNFTNKFRSYVFLYVSYWTNWFSSVTWIGGSFAENRMWVWINDNWISTSMTISWVITETMIIDLESWTWTATATNWYSNSWTLNSTQISSIKNCIWIWIWPSWWWWGNSSWWITSLSVEIEFYNTVAYFSMRWDFKDYSGWWYDLSITDWSYTLWNEYNTVTNIWGKNTSFTYSTSSSYTLSCWANLTSNANMLFLWSDSASWRWMTVSAQLAACVVNNTQYSTTVATGKLNERCLYTAVFDYTNHKIIYYQNTEKIAETTTSSWWIRWWRWITLNKGSDYASANLNWKLWQMVCENVAWSDNDVADYYNRSRYNYEDMPKYVEIYPGEGGGELKEKTFWPISAAWATRSWAEISVDWEIQSIEITWTICWWNSSSSWCVTDFWVTDVQSNNYNYWYGFFKNWPGWQNRSYYWWDDNNTQAGTAYMYNWTDSGALFYQRAPASTGSWSVDFIVDKEKLYSKIWDREKTYTWTSSDLPKIEEALSKIKYLTLGNTWNAQTPTIQVKVTYLAN